MIDKVKNLVIFSTLNQITNYLAIKQFNPEKIYNITYHKSTHSNLNSNMAVAKWDQWLNNVLDEEGLTKKKDIIKNIELQEGSRLEIDEFKKVIKDEIIEGVKKGEPIFWHMTGGQRIYALAIQELINDNDRKQDVIFYLEGNSEKIITLPPKKLNGSLLQYAFDDLKFETLFKLMGYNLNKGLSSKALIEQGKSNINNEEYNFYSLLYNYMVPVDEGDKLDILEITLEGKPPYKGTFRDLLIESNSIGKGEENGADTRRIFVEELFKAVPNQNLGEYNIEKLEELGKSYPAGYVFEKIVGYRIYKSIEELKKLDKVVGMAMGLKVSSADEDDSNEVRDELDIVLLLNTGRIINFECKSGAMSGDNAKSHNFTTYRLSGVFGAPVFLTPLYKNESDITKVQANKINKDSSILEKLQSAERAAYRANIEIIHLDKVEDMIKKLI